MDGFAVEVGGCHFRVREVNRASTYQGTARRRCLGSGQAGRRRRIVVDDPFGGECSRCAIRHGLALEVPVVHETQRASPYRRTQTRWARHISLRRQSRMGCPWGFQHLDARFFGSGLLASHREVRNLKLAVQSEHRARISPGRLPDAAWGVADTLPESERQAEYDRLEQKYGPRNASTNGAGKTTSRRPRLTHASAGAREHPLRTDHGQENTGARRARTRRSLSRSSRSRHHASLRRSRPSAGLKRITQRRSHALRLRSQSSRTASPSSAPPPMAEHMAAITSGSESSPPSSAARCPSMSAASSIPRSKKPRPPSPRMRRPSQHSERTTDEATHTNTKDRNGRRSGDPHDRRPAGSQGHRRPRVQGRGYSSVTDHLYSMGSYDERVAPGAFAETLAGRPDVQLLINHGSSGGSGMPLARTTIPLGQVGHLSLAEDYKGPSFLSATRS